MALVKFQGRSLAWQCLLGGITSIPQHRALLLGCPSPRQWHAGQAHLPHLTHPCCCNSGRSLVSIPKHASSTGYLPANSSCLTQALMSPLLVGSCHRPPLPLLPMPAKLPCVRR
jgi:hypothetical protein